MQRRQSAGSPPAHPWLIPPVHETNRQPSAWHQLQKDGLYIAVTAYSFSLARPLPATYAAPMVHGPTPRLTCSPTTSIESTGYPVTPNHDDTFTFGVLDGHLSLFKNSSEVWEESKDADCDPFGILVADAGIPTSPSPSLLSGMDLLGDTIPPPLPEVTAASIQLESRQITVARRASFLDFPSPPTPVPNRRMTLGDSRSISGNLPVPTVTLPSHPSLGASHECLPQPTRLSQSGALPRRSTLPPSALRPDKLRGSNELTTSFQPWEARGSAVTRTDPPEVPSLPRTSSSLLGPGNAGYNVSSTIRRPRQQEASDTFTSFIDMSVSEPTLSKSRIHKLFSGIFGRLKLRSNRH